MGPYSPTPEPVSDKIKLVVAAVIIVLFLFLLPGAFEALKQLSQPVQ